MPGRRILAAAAAAIAATAIGSGAVSQTSAPVAVLDHVIYGVSDLAAAARHFETEHGVAPVFGGVHPGRGSANFLAALDGGAYLEIIGPNPEISPPEQTGAMLAALERPQLITFAFRTADADETARAARDAGFDPAGPTPGSRRTPDGGALTWRAVALGGHDFCEYAPFFIEWGAGSAHPSTTSPAGLSVEKIRIFHPQADKLNAAYAALGAPIEAEAAAEPRMEVTLNGPAGAFTLSKAGACETSLF